MLHGRFTYGCEQVMSKKSKSKVKLGYTIVRSKA